MHTTTIARIARQTAEDHQRRAAQAEREGVRILVDYRTVQHVATSASDTSRCYHVPRTAAPARAGHSWAAASITACCSPSWAVSRTRTRHHLWSPASVTPT